MYFVILLIVSMFRLFHVLKDVPKDVIHPVRFCMAEGARRLCVSCTVKVLRDLQSRDYSSHGRTKDFRCARLHIAVGRNTSRRWIVAIKQRRLNVSTTWISRAVQQETCDAE